MRESPATCPYESLTSFKLFTSRDIHWTDEYSDTCSSIECISRSNTALLASPVIISVKTFWAWDIPVGYLFSFIVLVRDELFDLLERQVITLRYFPVCFSCCFSPEHFFTQHLYFSIRSRHNDDLLSYIYSTTRGLFFYCSFFIRQSGLRSAG